MSGWRKNIVKYILSCLLILYAQTALAATTMRVVYVPEPGYLTHNPDNSYSGYLYGYMHLLATYADVDFQYIDKETSQECMEAAFRRQCGYLSERSEEG